MRPKSRKGAVRAETNLPEGPLLYVVVILVVIVIAIVIVVFVFVFVFVVVVVFVVVFVVAVIIKTSWGCWFWVGRGGRPPPSIF